LPLRVKNRMKTAASMITGPARYDPSLGRFIQLDSYLGDFSTPRTLNRLLVRLEQSASGISTPPGMQDVMPNTNYPRQAVRRAPILTS
jgi:hypothetical protein